MMDDKRPLYRRGKWTAFALSLVALVALVALSGALGVAVPDLVLVALASASPAYLGAQGWHDAAKAKAWGDPD